jgi:hypothetical protein
MRATSATTPIWDIQDSIKGSCAFSHGQAWKRRLQISFVNVHPSGLLQPLPSLAIHHHGLRRTYTNCLMDPTSFWWTWNQYIHFVPLQHTFYWSSSQQPYTQTYMVSLPYAKLAFQFFCPQFGASSFSHLSWRITSKITVQCLLTCPSYQRCIQFTLIHRRLNAWSKEGTWQCQRLWRNGLVFLMMQGPGKTGGYSSCDLLLLLYGYASSSKVGSVTRWNLEDTRRRTRRWRHNKVAHRECVISSS